MFIGSINARMRAVLAELAPQWKDSPVYVACSGNFTVERILAAHGVGPIYSNDVSIYSCALGWYLTGEPHEYRVTDGRFDFITAAYLHPGPPLIATLLLVGEILKAGNNKHANRLRDEYRRRWEQVHEASRKRIEVALQGLKIAGYMAGDCRDFLTAADQAATCVTFPPTYKGGYEQLFKKLEAVFAWPKPSYRLFDPEDFELFCDQVRSFRRWMISSDVEHEKFRENLVAKVQTGLYSKPVFVYCGGASGVHRVAMARQQIGRNVLAPHTGEVKAVPRFVRLDRKVFNAIRSQYLARGIMPAPPQRCYAVVSEGKLIGCLGFSGPSAGVPWDVYMMSDFAVRPTPHKRLSKLILAVAVSVEMQHALEEWLCQRVRKLGTTAFTDKPVSMKYRGVFDLHSRKPGQLNYMADMGQWTLAGGFEWWNSRQEKKESR